MVSFYAFPVIFIDNVLFKKGTLINRVGVWTPWTPPGSAPYLKVLESHIVFRFISPRV